MSTGQHNIKHTGEVIASKDGVDVINCVSCGYAHISPFPTAEELSTFYREEFYQSEKDGYLESAQRDSEWLQATYHDRYDVFERLLPQDRRKILDVGCGPGFFLETGLKRKWSVLGLEPSPHAAAFARGHGVEVIEAFFNAKNASTIARQDVIHMSQVLEHTPNVDEILDSAHGLLADNGLLCVSVPNDFNPLQNALIKDKHHRKWWVEPSHHVNYFTFDSLERLLERHGFTPVHRSATFPLEMLALMGEDYIAEPNVGPAVHEKRKAFEMALERTGNRAVKQAFHEALAQAGLGRLAIVTARKLTRPDG